MNSWLHVSTMMSKNNCTNFEDEELKIITWYSSWGDSFSIEWFDDPGISESDDIIGDDEEGVSQNSQILTENIQEELVLWITYF